jgi:hypothetical protein
MNNFVFVVCGGKEHIEELNFSLKFLRHYSKNEIIVLTDSKRNEIEIEHDNIIEVKTPEQYTNHQASIFIKTGLYKFLDSSHNYCYLDGDVVAVSPDVDTIFSKFVSPVTFATDHCPINEFSPHAMNCNCIADLTEKEELFNTKLGELFGKIDLSNHIVKKQREELLKVFEKFRKNPIKYFPYLMIYWIKRYVLPVKNIKLSNAVFDKSTKCWYNASNDIILFDYPYYEKRLWKESGIRYNRRLNFWEDSDNNKYEFKSPSCSHLTEYISKQYGIAIPENWRHWNGGVFLFNKESHDFLSFWHKITLEEFDNPYTKIRDQGTLAISTWKFNLENNARLPVNYNFITEFEDNNIAYSKDIGYTNDYFKTVFKPCFLHVYHEWGRTGWSIWDSIIALGKKEGIL